MLIGEVYHAADWFVPGAGRSRPVNKINVAYGLVRALMEFERDRAISLGPVTWTVLEPEDDRIDGDPPERGMNLLVAEAAVVDMEYREGSVTSDVLSRVVDIDAGGKAMLQ